MPISVKKLSENIGAEVEGVDIALGVDDKSFQQLWGAFQKYAVLVFHDQDITDEQQITFSTGFGSIEPSLPNDPLGHGRPVFYISNVDENGLIIPPEDTRSLYQSGNMLWHSDGSFRPVPLRASLLSAKVVPPAGGDTEYASLRTAYSSLPEAKKAELEGLIAKHSMANSRAQIAPNLLSKEFQDEIPPADHLIVRTISGTGEKVLFVGSYASHIIGWPIDKGRSLLKKLLEWSTQPQFVYRHSWCLNDLVMWDNRYCLHRGRPWDSGSHKRIMHRTTLTGDGPSVAQQW